MVTADVKLDPSHAFLQALAAAGVPLLHLDKDPSAAGWDAALDAVVTGSHNAVVVVGDMEHVGGLERAVLVHLTRGQADGRAVQGASGHGVWWNSRLNAFSRCSTQLVLVTPDP